MPRWIDSHASLLPRLCSAGLLARTGTEKEAAALLAACPRARGVAHVQLVGRRLAAVASSAAASCCSAAAATSHPAHTHNTPSSTYDTTEHIFQLMMSPQVGSSGSSPEKPRILHVAAAAPDGRARRSSSAAASHAPHSSWGCNAASIVCLLLLVWSVWVTVMLLVYLLPSVLEPIVGRLELEQRNAAAERHHLIGAAYINNNRRGEEEERARAERRIETLELVSHSDHPAAIPAAHLARAAHHTSAIPIDADADERQDTSVRLLHSSALSGVPPSLADFDSPSDSASDSASDSSPFTPRNWVPSSAPFVRAPPPTQAAAPPSTVSRVYRLIKSKLKEKKDRLMREHGFGASEEEDAEAEFDDRDDETDASKTMATTTTTTTAEMPSDAPYSYLPPHASDTAAVTTHGRKRRSITIARRRHR